MFDKKKMVLFQVVLLASFIFAITHNLDSAIGIDLENKNLMNLDYKTTDPIDIGGNDGFDPEVWDGDSGSDGTSCNPWILDGYLFEDVRSAISIAHVDVHFVIRNCTFSNIEDEGIYIIDTETGCITDNYFENCGVAIILKQYCYNTVICDNEFRNNGRGIHIEYSSLINVISNYMFEDNYSVLLEEDANNCTISYNTIGRCLNDGLRIWFGEFNEISKNIFMNNTLYGVRIVNTSNNFLTENNFLFNNLLGIQGYDDFSTNVWDANHWNDLVGAGVYTLDGPGGNTDSNPSTDYIEITEIGCPSQCFACVDSTSIIFSLASIAIIGLIIYTKKKKF